MSSRTKTLLLVLLFFAGGASSSLYLLQNQPVEDEPEAVLYRLTGGLRVFIIDAIWLRMRAHQFEGKESLVLTDARTLLALEPDSARVRAFLHFHLTFNMARKAVTESARTEWFKEGLDIMDEGLLRDPLSFVLNDELGMTFLMRSRAMDFTESPASALFREVCFERYKSYPVQLAPIYLEKAYEAQSDPANLFRFMTALLDAACYETAQESYARAARLWGKVLEHITPWLELADLENKEDAAELKRYYQDCEAYCGLLGRVAAGETLDPEDLKRIETLKSSIESNLFHDDWE